MVADESLGAIANEITVVNRMYIYMYRCTVGIFYIHVGPRRRIPVRGPYTYMYMYTNLPVPWEASHCCSSVWWLPFPLGASSS